MNLESLEVKTWLELNAKLQQKKNGLRRELYKRGVLQKQGNNSFDHYTYFSEAQYKILFTELFSNFGLELKFDELEYQTFEGSEKQANGRMPRIMFTLFDAETGFFETTTITGEGIDKGDKAGYKAYTGALKYYLADTFMVATGDDPETESPQATMNQKRQPQRRIQKDAVPDINAEIAIPRQYLPNDPQPQAEAFPQAEEVRKASPKQVEILREKYTGENLTKLLEVNGITCLEEMPMKKASSLIEIIMKK